MARTTQVTLTPNSTNTVVDMKTTAGGPSVTLRNPHASEPILLFGNENLPGNGPTPGIGAAYKLTAGAVLVMQLTGEEIIYAAPNSQTTTVTIEVFRTNWSR